MCILKWKANNIYVYIYGKWHTKYFWSLYTFKMFTEKLQEKNLDSYYTVVLE